ncbi:MAG TPA: HD domain-containing phosphohydrolase [Gemmatimonadaceae bacterium]|nr:HD domain-containing phosphohydrolase [Gemmatimonadaceae bacterium]
MIDSTASPLPPTLSPDTLSPARRPDTETPGIARILVVEDEATIRRALARFLRERGYDVHECGSGPAALAILQHERFVVMLCDVRMPEMSGLDVVPRALEIDRNLAVLMLTAVNEASAATEALSRGALDYLVKPVAFADLQLAVERAVHRRQLEIDRRNVERHIREEVMVRTMELEREKASLHALTIGIAETLINAMEAKDVYLRGHSRRVAEQAAAVAEEMGFDADLVENVRLAGRLHDIGKIGIREDILNKPGALTAEEYAHVQEHVRIGMEILQPLRHIPVALEFIHDHHEHYDGSGYPRGKSGTDISIGGRILAACDAFDAMTSRRAFREAYDEKSTIAYLEAEVGRLLDPTVFAALEKVVVRRKTLTFIDDLHA